MQLTSNLPPCPARLEPLALEGTHVRLEPLGQQHFEALRTAALAEPRIWDYMTTRVRDDDDVRTWINLALTAQQSNGLTLPFAVVERVSNRAIGSTRLFDYRPHDRGVEIGYTWYHPAVWGTAVNPESKLLLMQHAFETLHCVRVQFKADERNQRSRAAIARLGAREEGTLRGHMLLPGNVLRNSVYYSILRDEWPQVKASLLDRLHTEY